MTRLRWTDGDPELRDLLADAKHIDEAPAAAKARVAELVHRSVAVIPAAATHGLATHGLASKGAAGIGAAKLGGAGLAAKAVVGVAILIGVGGGVGAAVHATSARSPARSTVVVSESRVTPALPPLSVSAAPPVPDREPPPAPPSIAPAPPPAPVASVPPRRPSLAEERALLDPARAALSAGDADAALEATRAHERRFPQGVLAEEREAIAIRALVLEGRVEEARRRASRFAARHPDSLVLPAILASLPAGP